jgi:hypothetical protein
MAEASGKNVFCCWVTWTIMYMIVLRRFQSRLHFWAVAFTAGATVLTVLSDDYKTDNHVFSGVRHHIYPFVDMLHDCVPHAGTCMQIQRWVRTRTDKFFGIEDKRANERVDGK